MSDSAVTGNTSTDTPVSPSSADFNAILNVLAGKMDAMASAIQGYQIVFSMRTLDDTAAKRMRLKNGQTRKAINLTLFLSTH